MHTLIGYTDQPTEMQLLGYVAVLVVTVMLMRLTGSRTAPPHRGRLMTTGDAANLICRGYKTAPDNAWLRRDRHIRRTALR